jgi:hypothetical protein
VSDTDREVDAYVRDRTRRTVARSELLKLSKLARSIELEERSNTSLAWRIVLVIAAVVACAFLVSLAAVVSAETSLFVLSIVGGLVLGVGLIFWSTRRSRKLELDRSARAERRDYR